MGDLDAVYRGSDAVALAGLVKRGEVSAGELVEAGIRAIEEMNPGLNAVIHTRYDIGRAAAAQVDKAAPLAGVPFLLKELATGWAGVQATNASRFLQGQVSQGDSVLTGRIKAAGLCLLGKTNSPENGWCISTEPALYGPTVNPWDARLTPGGSSGGSSVAVAMGMVPIAEASDAAGSIRVPASCCGVVGLKPSRGRVTLAPLADYFNGAAYFMCNTRTVRDTAAYLDAVAGAMPGDLYALPIPAGGFAGAAGARPRGLRVGYTVTAPDGGPVDPEVRAAVEAVARCLEGLGHHVEEKDMGLDAGALWPVYANMTTVENAGFYGWMESVIGRPIGPGEVENITAAIIARGRATRAVDHAGAVERLRQEGRGIVQDLSPYDIYLTPVLTQRPRPVGYYDMSMTDLDAYNALWGDAMFMWPFNISGQPAMAVPLGQFADGVPLGVQVVGRIGDEATVLAVAGVLEEAMPWAGRRPPGVGHA